MFNFSIRYKVYLIIVAFIALFSPILFVYFPAKQKKLLTQSYEKEVQGIARTVALGVRIALEEHNFDGVQTAMDYARKDSRMIFVSMYKTDSLGNRNYLSTIPKTIDPSSYLANNQQNILVQSIPLNLEQLKGGIIVCFSTKTINDEITQATRTTIFLSAIVTLLGIAIGFFVSRLIIKPVNALINVTERITEGHLNVRAQKEHNDEIGKLADSFNYMIQNLELNTTQLEAQQKDLKQKNKLITDSINYSRRIQQVLLYNESDIKQCFPNAFVFFKPKDIVSGDFLWVKKTEQHTYIALVDCTGHGVPGAMMSIIGHFILNSIYRNNVAPLPADILEKLNDNMRQSLKQETHDASDGMDLALFRIDNETNEVIFSGANRNLYHFVSASQMCQFKGDRKGIGGKPPKNHEFVNHTLTLKPQEWLITYSDGIQDQFGADNSKFGKTRVSNVVAANFNSSGHEMLEALDTALRQHQGNTKQIDDILLIGIKL